MQSTTRKTMPLFIILCFCLLPLGSFSAELEQHIVNVDGHPMSLWSKRIVNPKATMLLLHGRTYSALPDFDLQVVGENLSFMDGLNEKSYDVYALDGRGYGSTPRDASGWLTPNRHAKDVIAIINWIKALDHTDIHIYGWSYGSMITQLVAQQAPTLMASITLFGYPIDPSKKIDSISYPAIAPAPAKANTKAHAASDFITPGSISQNAIDAYVKVALKADPIRVDFKNLEEWSVLSAAAITTPTLLIQGEFDPLANTAVHAAVFPAINTAKKWWVVLKGGDHAALLEKPRIEMLNAIDAFISSL